MLAHTGHTYGCTPYKNTADRCVERSSGSGTHHVLIAVFVFVVAVFDERFTVEVFRGTERTLKRRPVRN